MFLAVVVDVFVSLLLIMMEFPVGGWDQLIIVASFVIVQYNLELNELNRQFDELSSCGEKVGEETTNGRQLPRRSEEGGAGGGIIAASVDAEEAVELLYSSHRATQATANKET